MCVMAGKWLMKLYTSGATPLDSMPDVNSLTLVGQTYVPTISFNQDSAFQQAIPGTPADRFAATWRGRFSVNAPGAYTFCTTSDDGSSLFIDGETIVDNGGLHGAQRRSPWARLHVHA
jgi:hypothetical protein